MNALLATPRRLKKYIISREHEFFAVTAPRLEKLCAKELAVILPQNALIVQRGGVTFYGRPEVMYAANLNLRSATRILMRMGVFSASNFTEFARKLKEIAFELYLQGNELPQISIAAHHCRLYHTEALRELVEKHLAVQFPAAISAGDSAPTLYVRGADNTFTFSLDTSGAGLYLRGLKPHGGIAPLRETLASYILHKAGYRGGLLMDPMCGSGTFSLEAALTVGGVAPGLMRDFAFFKAPFFNMPQWEYLKRQALTLQKPAPDKPLIIASDKDAAACTALEKTVADLELTTFIKVVNRDFFSLNPVKVFGKKCGLVVLNPPYGRRLLDRAEAENLYGAICKKLNDDFKGWRIAIVAPNKEWLSVKNVHFHKIWHGGLHLHLGVFKVKF